MKTSKFFIVLILVLVSNMAFAAAGKVVLIIEPPATDGGECLMFYHVEYRDIDGGSWQKCRPILVPSVDKGNGQFEYVNVPYALENLQEAKAYVFRVSAENYYGTGDPGRESNIILVTDKDIYNVKVRSGDGIDRFGTGGSSVLSGVSSVDQSRTSGVFYRKEED